MYCPHDRLPCIDDLCRGSGYCFYHGGDSMLIYCHGGCNRLVAADGSDDGDCCCEPTDDLDDDE
jgi:hypothetical protein